MPNTEITKVNALYGPGTVLGWYLTLVAIAVAWTVHPKRSGSDSLDADLFVMLTLPVVAVGDLLWQLRHFVTVNSTFVTPALTSMGIEAPFIVTEASMDLSVLLFLVAAWKIKIKRAVVIGAVGLTCYGAEWYVYLSGINSRGLEKLFTRSFLADSATGMVVTGVTLGICVFAAMLLTVMFYANRANQTEGPSPSSQPTESGEPHNLRSDGNSDDEAEAELDRRDRIRFDRFQRAGRDLARLAQLLLPAQEEAFRDHSAAIRSITFMTVIFLPLTFVTSVFYGSAGPGPSLPDDVTGLLEHFIRIIFPPTQTSMDDLDQVVAALGGGTILAFNLFSATRCRYLQRREARRKQDEINRRNDIRLRRLLGQYSRQPALQT